MIATRMSAPSIQVEKKRSGGIVDEVFVAALLRRRGPDGLGQLFRPLGVFGETGEIYVFGARKIRGGNDGCQRPAFADQVPDEKIASLQRRDEPDGKTAENANRFESG